MNKIIVTISLLFAVVFTAQKKEDIKPEVVKMIDATNKMDFNKIMDYTYPAIFELAPREMMMEMMAETFENDMMSITLLEAKGEIIISEMKAIKNGHYAVVNFPTKMKMTFKNDVPEAQINLMIESIKTSMNAENVVFNADENALTINNSSIAIAAYDKITENTWKFLNYQASQREQIKMFFDEDILNDLGL